MSELISKQFHNFVFNQGDIGGTKDVIADLNGVVSCNDIALSAVLDSGVGEKYFYESMKLAENVIISFEKEQPKLNENQEIVLAWLKREHFDSYIKSVLSNLYFYVNMTAIGDLENEEIQEMVNAYEELSQEAFAQVLQAFANWALDQC